MLSEYVLNLIPGTWRLLCSLGLPSSEVIDPTHDVDLNHQEDRMQTVASLVSTVQGLMEELKISATTALDNRILGSLAIPSSTGAPVLQTTEVPYVRVA